MLRTRSVVALTILAFGLAACSSSGSGGGYGGGGQHPSSSAAGTTAAATVATSTVGSLGTVLVDGTGRTLYLFESDNNTTSTCTGTCAGTWPALLTGSAPAASGGADASMLGTTTRDDGTTQVTYNGHPVYVYSGDSAPGDANGQDIGGVWYTVTVKGTPNDPSSSKGGGYGSGGYGNG